MDGLAPIDWMNAIEESARELALTTLGFEGCTIQHDLPALPPALLGAYLPLGTAQQPMQVALLSDRFGCQLLAKALLGLGHRDDDLSPCDMGDAVSEILNLLAGGLKRRLQGRADLKLGLPLFLHGTLESSAQIAILSAELMLGQVRAFVVFATPKLVTVVARPPGHAA